jgi:RNA polymerase sigma-70 factor (ECF subfamily)
MTTRGYTIADPHPAVPETGAVPITESFDAFYLREFPRMVALAAAVSGSRLIAEDLAQEAMVKANRRWDRIASYDKPGAWVRRVTINLATSAVRKRAAEAKRMLGLGRRSEPLGEPEPDDVDVWSAVKRLPGKQRAAIALFYLEDRPVGEIAAILDCAEATAKVHLHRGRQALAAALTESSSS